MTGALVVYSIKRNVIIGSGVQLIQARVLFGKVKKPKVVECLWDLITMIGPASAKRLMITLCSMLSKGS